MIIHSNLTNTLYFLIIKLYKIINLYYSYSIHAHSERERDLCALCCYLVLGLLGFKTLGTNVLELQYVLCWQAMIKT